MPSTRTPASDSDPASSGAEDRFTFRFDARYALAGALFGITPVTAWVRVTGTELVVRFGLWSLRTPRSNVTGTQRSGPYGVWRTIGPARLSLADSGATFATNGLSGLCISFAEPQSIVLPAGLVKSPGLTVTVEDVERLQRVLQP